MDKNVRPYKQRKNTCAISCMMMVLEYFKKIEKANWFEERRLYKIYKSNYLDGTPFSAIAYHLSKKNLLVNLFHEDQDLFNNNKHIIDERTYNLSINEYKNLLDMALNEGTHIYTGVTINDKLLKQELDQNKLLIVAGEFDNILHAILITGYNEDNFYVCDPLYKNKQVRSLNEINEFMATDIGKWFISVKNK